MRAAVGIGGPSGRLIALARRRSVSVDARHGSGSVWIPDGWTPSRLLGW